MTLSLMYLLIAVQIGAQVDEIIQGKQRSKD